MSDDAERLRIRADLTDWTLGDRPEAEDGSLTRLFQTKTITTYPTAKGVFYAMTTATVLGTETEGTAGAVTYPAGDTVYGFLPLSAQSIPPNGTQVVASFTPNRWTIQW